MKTDLYKNCIGDAAQIIINGGLVAVPTETVYGLASDGMNSKAVSRIYEVKGRPEVKPLSLMVSGVDDINKFCHDVPEYGFNLAANLWPGPVTLIFKANSNIPPIVLAGGDTVGLRCPDSPLTLELIRKADCALAAPSANPSGFPSPKEASEVIEYFDGMIDAVIDGGRCELGVESTIVDCSTDRIKVLRRGALNMFVVGITGQSGAGKTSALECLREDGYAIIDCDALYHDMLDNDRLLNGDLISAFPQCYDGEVLNRKKLGSVVFNSPDLLSRLNIITHNHIFSAVLLKLFEFKKSGINHIAIDAVELISSGLSKICDKTIGVIADDDVRLNRIMHRDTITEDEAKLRIRAQKSNDYYLSNCDDVVYNNSSYGDFLDSFKEVLNNGKN